MGAVAGAALLIGGAGMSGNSATKKRKQLLGYQNAELPNYDLYNQNYYGDLSQYEDQSRGIAMRANEDLTQLALNRQERALPGVRNAISTGFEQLMPLLRGELPQSVLDNFKRSGGASSVGLGFGGSGFGDLNAALFGARGSLAAMQMGYGMLPALLGAAPQFGTQSPTAFLEGLMTPGQMAQTQLGVRGQNVSLAQTGAGMDTASDVWGGMLGFLGGTLMGGVGGGMGGGGGPTMGYGGSFGTGAGPSSYGNLQGVSRLY